MNSSSADTAGTIATIQSAYRRARAQSGERDWLAPVRDAALAAFARGGFPTTSEEDWKYTNLAALAEASGELLAAEAQPVDRAAIAAMLDRLPRRPDDYTLVFANGRVDPSLSTLPLAGTAIRLTTLADAGARDRQRFIDWLGASASGGLPALNAAFMADGVIMDILPDAQEPPSINVVFASDDQAISTQPRMQINAAPGSYARVCEYHVGRGPGWTNATTDIHCAADSRLTYIKLQDEDSAANHTARQTVTLAESSFFRAAHFDLGARLARNDLRVLMTGPGSRAELFGLFLADGRRHVDNHTHTDHFGGHTLSRESYRGIANDHGRGVFNGKIIVHEGADGTDAQLDNRNLLLAKTAEIDTKPELEIYTDDVKCAHGATTGQLDEQALFYLRARGITSRLARHMLVLAFAREIVERFDPAADELTEYINRTLQQRLPE